MVEPVGQAGGRLVLEGVEQALLTLLAAVVVEQPVAGDADQPARQAAALRGSSRPGCARR